MRPPTRRAALGLAIAGPLGVAGCTDLPVIGPLTAGWILPRQAQGGIDTPDYERVYAAVRGEKNPVKAVDLAFVDPAFLRADVPYSGVEPPGTVVVDLKARTLFLILAPGRARRYGIAVGPEATGFSGLGVIARAESWPAPVSPSAATGRHLQGARALYLAANGQETGFAIHGMPDPLVVGTAAKAGSVSLINQDIIDLAGRVSPGTRVVVIG